MKYIKLIFSFFLLVGCTHQAVQNEQSTSLKQQIPKEKSDTSIFSAYLNNRIFSFNADRRGTVFFHATSPSLDEGTMSIEDEEYGLLGNYKITSNTSLMLNNIQVRYGEFNITKYNCTGVFSLLRDSIMIGTINPSASKSYHYRLYPSNK